MTSLESPNLDHPLSKGDLLYGGIQGVCLKALPVVGLFDSNPSLG